MNEQEYQKVISDRNAPTLYIRFRRYWGTVFPLGWHPVRDFPEDMDYRYLLSGSRVWAFVRRCSSSKSTRWQMVNSTHGWTLVKGTLHVDVRPHLVIDHEFLSLAYARGRERTEQSLDYGNPWIVCFQTEDLETLYYRLNRQQEIGNPVISLKKAIPRGSVDWLQ